MRTIKYKIITISLLTTGIVLMISSMVLFANKFYTFRNSMVNDLTIQAETIGSNCTAALTFDDQGAAQETLDALTIAHKIVYAELYDKDENSFVKFQRKNINEEVPPLHTLPYNGYQFGLRYVDIVHRITLDNEIVGVIFIRASLQEFYKFLRWYGGIIGIVIVCSLGIAFLILSRLQGKITRPIHTLRDAAKKVSAGNLTARVKVESNDEIGQLSSDFNKMIEDLHGTTVSRDYVDNIFKSMTETLIVTNPDATIRMANDAILKLLGYKTEELIGMSINKIIEENEIDESKITDSNYMGPCYDVEKYYVSKDGGKIPVLFSSSRMIDSSGKPSGFVCVARDITERKAVDAKLKNALEEAWRANKAKSVFLSSMSHELRTPLNSILGFAQLIESDTVEPLSVSQKEHMEHILKSGNHLLELINEVLDLSGIESGKAKLSLEGIDIDSVVSEVIVTVGPIAQKNSITIINKTKSDGQYIRADNTRLRQVLINLLSNAIKYNSVGGSVSIWIESPTDKMLRVNIEDTGLGIAKENYDSLFEPFNRLGAEMLNIEGTGVGLTITKKLVEMMGGSIGVESEEGKGTKFYVDFEKAEAPVLITDGTEEVVEEERNAEITERYTMLYVEDNPSNLKLVETVLRRRPGISLLTAPEVQLGIELARSHQPDIILMDINLPGMDGYEALDLLKSHDRTKEIPVIVISANAMPEDIKRGKAAGFKGYITKPININKFLDVVDGFLTN